MSVIEELKEWATEPHEIYQAVKDSGFNLPLKVTQAIGNIILEKIRDIQTFKKLETSNKEFEELVSTACNCKPDGLIAGKFIGGHQFIHSKCGRPVEAKDGNQ